MGLFFVLLLVPLSIQHLVVKKEHMGFEKKNKYALLFFFVFLTLLVMLRHESVGTDTRNYIFFFREFSVMGWGDLTKNTIEYGFSYFNKIVSLISTEPQFFLAVVALAVCAMIYPTYRRLCEDASLTIVIFCTMSTFAMMFSGLRQMLAIGIGFIAYEFTRRKKPVFFILAVMFAMLFHTSAFILVFMYPLYHARITRKWLLAVVPVLVAIFIFNKQIFTFLAEILERYTEYDGEIAMTGAYTMLILFIVFTVFAFLIPDEARLDSETVGLRNLLLLALALQMFAPLHTLAMRMNYYYIIFI